MRMYTSPVTYLALVLFLISCSPQPTASPFVPPSGSSSATSIGADPLTPPPLPTVFSGNPTTEIAPTSPAFTSNCVNSLRFIEDVTYPDGSIVRTGEKIEKIWRVENNGTCSWDSRYRMRLVSGDQLGAPAELALFPALPGTQADLRIIFIAPSESRYYQSMWQAYSPEGLAFGDPFYINIFIQYP